MLCAGSQLCTHDDKPELSCRHITIDAKEDWHQTCPRCNDGGQQMSCCLRERQLHSFSHRNEGYVRRQHGLECTGLGAKSCSLSCCMIPAVFKSWLLRILAILLDQQSVSLCNLTIYALTDHAWSHQDFAGSWSQQSSGKTVLHEMWVFCATYLEGNATSQAHLSHTECFSIDVLVQMWAYCYGILYWLSYRTLTAASRTWKNCCVISAV